MLHHRFIGNSKAKNLIVFLHEGLGCIEMWKSFPQMVVDALDCYGLVYDRSGYGNSKGSLIDRDVDYLHQAAEELNNFIHKLNLEEYDISLYGHSDGGSIALIYAGNHPEKIKYLITEAAHAFVEQVTLDGVKAAIQPFKDGKLDGLKKFHGDRFEEVFWAWNNIWLDPRFEPWNILEELKRINVPSLIIQGIDDQYGTPKQVKDIVNSIGATATPLLIENTGHSPHKTHASKIIEALSRKFDWDE
ncbi:MAG: alpha/beta hydrolase [Crocinitomicaceae bacterium]|nr:alpha/beta hydrolase [Crocinitomicaceae bacterium]MCH2234555.1 alpha/beta hydrolase [Crocinitomicaceae bacterium]